MDKVFNWFAFLFGAVGGALASLFGGFDEILMVLVFLSFADFLSGIVKSVINKKLSSQICFKGIMKKVAIYVIVAISCVLQNNLFPTIPLREITIFFYIANEGLSIIENLSEFISIPQKIKEILEQIRINNKN